MRTAGTKVQIVETLPLQSADSLEQVRARNMQYMFNLSFSSSANCEAVPSTPEEGGRDQRLPPHGLQQSCCHQYFIRHGLN